MIATDHMTNPEFPQQSSTRRTNAVENQLFVLRSSIEQLRKAYNGHDVEWSDVGKFHTEFPKLNSTYMKSLT